MIRLNTKYVVGFMFDLDCKRVALIEKQKPTWQAGKLNGIGGKREFFEKLQLWENSSLAMNREFKEETGIHIPNYNWHPIIKMSGMDTDNLGNWEVDVFFTKSSLIDKIKQQEVEKPIIVEVSNLPNNIIPNLQWIIPICLDEELRTGYSADIGTKIFMNANH